MDSKSITILGIAFMLLGIVAMTHQGNSEMNGEKVPNVGPAQADADSQLAIPIAPLWGGLVLVGAIVLAVSGVEKSS